MKFLSILLLIFTFFLFGCGESEPKPSKTPEEPLESANIHNAQNSLDWAGTYKAVIPCASCEGIETSLTLNYDGSYSLSLTYLGEVDPNLFETKGSISWNVAGNTITLENEASPNQYFVGENYLAKLNKDGNRITGDLASHYILEKE